MDWYVHSEAVEEFLELPERVRRSVRENIESRMQREKGITGQRDVGLSYDSHGEPVFYFKVEDIGYRVFFDFSDGDLVMVGFRPRDEDTYVNVRELTKRTSE